MAQSVTGEPPNIATPPTLVPPELTIPVDCGYLPHEADQRIHGRRQKPRLRHNSESSTRGAARGDFAEWLNSHTRLLQSRHRPSQVAQKQRPSQSVSPWR